MFWFLLNIISHTFFHGAAESKYLPFYRITQCYSRIRIAHTYIVITVCQAIALPIFTHLMFLPYNPLRWVPSVLVWLQNKAEPEAEGSTHYFVQGAIPRKQGWGKRERRSRLEAVLSSWLPPSVINCPSSQGYPLMRPSCQKPHQLPCGQLYRRSREELLTYHLSSSLWQFLSTHSFGLAQGTPQHQQGSLRIEGLRWGTL